MSVAYTEAAHNSINYGPRNVVKCRICYDNVCPRWRLTLKISKYFSILHHAKEDIPSFLAPNFVVLNFSFIPNKCVKEPRNSILRDILETMWERM